METATLNKPVINVSFLSELRKFYVSGSTRSYAFRIKQLRAFKDAVKRYEPEIFEALYADLKKNPEDF